ncbi:MAG: class I SAM-dependent methyltransferase [Longimicrobiales bacterium]
MGSETSPLLGHYATGYEAERLSKGTGLLEFSRTQEILARCLPPPPGRVVDIGGGPGQYSSWLAARAYDISLLDIVPLHVEQARARFRQYGATTATAGVGDARALPYEDASHSVALLMGPLYHLQERMDRIKAAREAWRVLTSGGTMIVTAISRFASLIDGYVNGYISDPAFVSVVDQDLATGRHRNSTAEPAYFTDAYFHHPDELTAELREAGFTVGPLIAVEGPFWMLQNFNEHWSEETGRQRLLSYLRMIESDATMIGASAHIVAVCRK